ncbi:retinin-like [Teleopsis dalmanni]|uniref:retinin-like n=1 Tax=Teleopsis dalmanni TaxID=139649 RepID=UPI0018CD7EA9|nr:retinin-like [Teleopsis dalmanni]
MFKLVVLSALLAVAAARPGFIDSPLVLSAPASIAVQEPTLAKVGSVVKNIPTAVSHQSQSIVHSSANVVEDILAPAVRTTLTAAPIIRTIAAPAPIIKTIAAPASYLHASYAAGPLSYAAASPLGYSSGIW